MLNWKKITEYSVEGSPAPSRTVIKSVTEWQAQLSDEQFRVTRQHGTERPFSSELCSLFEPGLYGCVCCENELFLPDYSRLAIIFLFLEFHAKYPNFCHHRFFPW